MTRPNLFRDTKRLGFFVEHLAELPRWTWLYISDTETHITLDTLCMPSAINSHDVSEEETQEFEAYAERNGAQCFLCPDQLEEIIENLRQQRSDYSLQQLASAIDFYWRNDAFIDLSLDPA